jgi:uncharacterized membrane protein
MSNFLVFIFSNEQAANRMTPDLQSLQEQHKLLISDAAALIRKLDGKIKIEHLNSLVGSGTLGGPFWGMLIGLLFYMPWLGVPVSTITRILADKFSVYGISDSFIKEVGATIRPGYSALFLITENLAEDKIIEVLSRHKATLLRINLSKEDESRLREAFGAAD